MGIFFLHLLDEDWLRLYLKTIRWYSVQNVIMYAIDTGVKQTERTIFLHVISMGQKL